MQLFIYNKPAVVGKTYKTFLNEDVVLLSMTPPHKPSSTGRVYVKFVKEGRKTEYYPSVIGGEWK